MVTRAANLQTLTGSLPSAENSIAISKSRRIVWAPAKINLHLEILGKRADGYHALETLILVVDWFDTLEIESQTAAGIELTCTPSTLPTGPTNLVYKAADAFWRSLGQPAEHGVSVQLTKRIPQEAGMGGGSSDAAAMITTLNSLWQANWTADRLQQVCAEVGSDVGVFLTPPAGWCTGRGEVVEAASVGMCLHLVIVKPSIGLSTAEVYRRVKVPETPRSGDAIRQALSAGELADVAKHLFNRLEEPSYALCPELRTICQLLKSCDPVGCQMSGSGSALFAIARNRSDAQRIARDFTRLAKPLECSVFVARGGLLTE